ncbi:MAG: alpha-ketoglutarate-dependent dioxygenase AlkB [Crocinitomicaceae bacterium]
MDLFGFDEEINLLPKDGSVHYFGTLFSTEESQPYFHQLLHSIDWKNDVAILFGKRIETKRKVAWYGDKPYKYSYSNNTKTALPWTNELVELKKRIEEKTGETFNSCLLNLYHNGSEGMAWHSDGEKDLKKHGAIASVSFGAERKFAFKHKQTKETVNILLQTGSLLVMKDETQDFWLHRLPPTKKQTGPRINLTFRTIIE